MAAPAVPHPIIFAADPTYTPPGPAPPPGVLAINQLIANDLVLSLVREHNREARRTNRALHLSGGAHIFIPIRIRDGSSIGATFPRTADDVQDMTAAAVGAFSLFYNLTGVTWLDYRHATTAPRRRRKILAFIGALEA